MNEQKPFDWDAPWLSGVSVVKVGEIRRLSNGEPGIEDWTFYADDTAPPLSANDLKRMVDEQKGIQGQVEDILAKLACSHPPELTVYEAAQLIHEAYLSQVKRAGVISEGEIRAKCLGEGVYWAGELKCEVATDPLPVLMPQFKRVIQAELDHILKRLAGQSFETERKESDGKEAIINT